MKEVSIVGLDLAKRVFQVHAAGADGGVVLRRKLSRGQVLAFFAELPRCIVAMEACATAHYWAREIGKIGQIGGKDPRPSLDAQRKTKTGCTQRSRGWDQRFGHRQEFTTSRQTIMRVRDERSRSV